MERHESELRRVTRHPGDDNAARLEEGPETLEHLRIGELGRRRGRFRGCLGGGPYLYQGVHRHGVRAAQDDRVEIDTLDFRALHPEPPESHQ